MEANPWESTSEYTVDLGAAEKCLKLFESFRKFSYPGVSFNIILIATTTRQVVCTSKKIDIHEFD